MIPIGVRAFFRGVGNLTSLLLLALGALCLLWPERSLQIWYAPMTDEPISLGGYAIAFYRVSGALFVLLGILGLAF
ncbi:hypothetical protein [Halopelagius fulvigenes]|uniref:Uncharacterized protein n=1 Tax=Halopelagius fulvigenes TaxID=1198324 RepID=A0ABD5TZM4_9EURY